MSYILGEHPSSGAAGLCEGTASDRHRHQPGAVGAKGLFGHEDAEHHPEPSVSHGVSVLREHAGECVVFLMCVLFAPDFVFRA